MSLLEAFRLAFEQIRVQKLKSFFTVIGVTIGVTFLIAVVSIVTGMSRYMQDDLLGKIIAVNSFELRQRPNINIGDQTAAERRAMRARPPIFESDVPPVVAALPPNIKWATHSSGGLTIESAYAKPTSVELDAVSDQYFTIKDMDAALGRLPSAQEFALGSAVVVIGKDVADYDFPGLDPIGRSLRIKGVPYDVIGVAESQGSVFGQSLDKFIVVPERSAAARWVRPEHRVAGVTIQGESDPAMREAMETTREVMRVRRRLHPSQPDNFTLETSDSAMEFFNKIKGYIEIAGVALPAIGLVVGAIVIMNIMLVAVAERTHEIGIRKSLGARRSDILWQFMVESATLAALGATIGVALGIGFAKLLAAVTPLPAAVAIWSIFTGVGVGAGVGMIAGVYPASKASLLDPITALRHET
jgi:putative ABC transport system permease protein